MRTCRHRTETSSPSPRGSPQPGMKSTGRSSPGGTTILGRAPVRSPTRIVVALRRRGPQPGIGNPTGRSCLGVQRRRSVQRPLAGRRLCRSRGGAPTASDWKFRWTGRRLGDSAAAQCNVPDPNADFVAVCAGNAHSLGLKSDGTIVAWGANGYCSAPCRFRTRICAVAAGSVQQASCEVDGDAFREPSRAGADDGVRGPTRYTDLQSALAIPAPRNIGMGGGGAPTGRRRARIARLPSRSRTA